MERTRTKEQRDKGTKGQRDKGTKGQRDKGTKGQRDKGTKGQRDKEEKKWGESPVSQIFLVSLGFPPIFFSFFFFFDTLFERRREGRIRGRDHEHARLNVYCQKSR
jgi:hypothetical protein